MCLTAHVSLPLLPLLVVLSFALLSASWSDMMATALATGREKLCNGHAALCERGYSNATFVGSHNSAFVGALPVHNQFEPVTKQLEQGVRFLQAQTHLAADSSSSSSSGNGGREEQDGETAEIRLCHTNCLILDAGSLEAYLREVVRWLERHPREVVTLLLTNEDGIGVWEFAETFRRVGLEEHVFVPAGSKLELGEWPTLGEMVERGDRVVVFMDYHANVNLVPYILDQFDYFFEGPFDTLESDFPQCDVDRPSPDTDPNGRMYLVNHYLDIDFFGVLIPNQIESPFTNSFVSITAQAELCDHTYGRLPNVILLDWISVGEAMAAQEVLNGL